MANKLHERIVDKMGFLRHITTKITRLKRIAKVTILHPVISFRSNLSLTGCSLPQQSPILFQLDNANLQKKELHLKKRTLSVFCTMLDFKKKHYLRADFFTGFLPVPY
jgi:hypothetical protein